MFRCDPRSHTYNPCVRIFGVRRVVPRVLATRNPSTHIHNVVLQHLVLQQKWPQMMIVGQIHKVATVVGRIHSMQI
jgi:hypothetical protein